MKAYIIIILLIFSNYITAQKQLDTIYANESKNVALFFPEAIRQGVTGANNFVFTYNREKEQYFGLLQATPGMESNLLAVTKSGQVYSYILKYKNHLHKLNYFINEKESIGSELPKKIEQKPILKIKNVDKSRIRYFQKFSDFLLKLKYESIRTKRQNGIKLQLQKMAYNNFQVYLVFEVKNNSEIDFEIDYLKVYRASGNRRRKASFQRLEQEVIFKYKMADFIKTGKKKRFVYVLPKFVLGENEKLMLELKEFNGNRRLILETNY
ncbi:DUF4138 domain-containing protein [Algibacter agarivorans]